MEEFNYGTQNSWFEPSHILSIHDIESSYRNFSSVDDRTSNSDNSSQQRNWVSSPWPDYQLQNMCGTVDVSDSIWTNDISLDSLLKEDFPDTVHQQEHECRFPDFQWSSISQADLLSDLDVHSERILKGSTCMGGLNSIKESGILLVTGKTSNNGEIREIRQPSIFPPITSERADSSSNTKAQLLASTNSSIKNTSSDMDREKSLEATVLQELIDIMQQMNQSTRIGFRDAFYNLARNLKQHHATVQGNSKFIQNGPSSATDCNELLTVWKMATTGIRYC